MSKLLPDWARSSFSLRYATVDDESIPWLSGGSGPPLLLVHGLSASLDWWRANAPDLAARFRVCLVDLPGFGRLGRLRSNDSMHDHAGWLVRFMDAAGLDSVHLVGLSMGADIAIRIAAHHPERVDRLVLATPAAILPNGSIASYALIGINVLRELPLRMAPLALRDARWADLRTFWRSSQLLIDRDIRELLSQVRAPSLIICSNNDPVVPLSAAETFLDAIPDARMIVFPGAGHLVMLSDPAQFNREVAAFLSEPQSTSTGVASVTSDSPLRAESADM